MSKQSITVAFYRGKSNALLKKMTTIRESN
jgi:hypothetical protein